MPGISPDKQIIDGVGTAPVADAELLVQTLNGGSASVLFLSWDLEF